MTFGQRYSKVLFSICLGAGLLVAQVCNVVCVAANCAEEKKVVTSPQPTSHCHNAQTPTEPAPPHDSDNCQNHDLTVLLAASGAQFDVVGQLDWHPVALVPERLEFDFRSQPLERIRLSALRSPPRVPQRLILRI